MVISNYIFGVVFDLLKLLAILHIQFLLMRIYRRTIIKLYSCLDLRIISSSVSCFDTIDMRLWILIFWRNCWHKYTFLPSPFVYCSRVNVCTLVSIVRTHLVILRSRDFSFKKYFLIDYKCLFSTICIKIFEFNGVIFIIYLVGG